MQRAKRAAEKKTELEEEEQDARKKSDEVEQQTCHGWDQGAEKEYVSNRPQRHTGRAKVCSGGVGGGRRLLMAHLRIKNDGRHASKHTDGGPGCHIKALRGGGADWVD